MKMLHQYAELVNSFAYKLDTTGKDKKCGKNIGNYCLCLLVSEPCLDGIKKFGEEEIDCGGPCVKCSK